MEKHKIERDDKDFENMSDKELHQWARNENVITNQSRSEIISELKKKNK